MKILLLRSLANGIYNYYVILFVVVAHYRKSTKCNLCACIILNTQKSSHTHTRTKLGTQTSALDNCACAFIFVRCCGDLFVRVCVCV